MIFAFLFKIFIYWILERQREKEGENDREREKKHQFVAPLIYAFIACFLYVPLLGIESSMGLLDKTLTNWAMWPGPESSLPLLCAGL